MVSSFQRIKVQLSLMAQDNFVSYRSFICKTRGESVRFQAEKTLEVGTLRREPPSLRKPALGLLLLPEWKLTNLTKTGVFSRLFSGTGRYFLHTTMASGRRPEHKAPPEMFYNEEEARKYTSNSRMIEIQMTMSERAVELLSLPEDAPSYILDVGCGSGLSGETLTEQGHYWVGLDISSHMLDIASEREVEGDVFVSDMGEGMFFRPGTFDGVISISALQWLCNADKKSHHPPKRLYKFFCTLYSALRRGSRAVFQFYPENSQQLELITSQAMKAGFTGGVVVDYPNSTRAKKMFLCLFAGMSNPQIPKGLGTEGANSRVPTEVSYTDSRQRFRQLKGKPLKKSREWIKEKKERRRRQGKGEVRPDSKYTGRKRQHKF
ncbi:18S rRNA (guanine-N(7))-methyltransferase-like isoform X2 [Asterias amurensis]|uniref:18S rRNA (guanine-N(7))-methyltransferase-like isoform X2 n=1 Tax=Asterias amurensis TaxID=7602 RepID=UPI003AB14D45